MNDIRDNLRSVIKERGFLQSSIAKKAGMSSNKLSQILSKKRGLGADELLNICDVIGITPTDLRNYPLSKE